MVKPFGMRELVARIRAVARRAGPTDATPQSATQEIGPLSIDRRSQKVFVNGEDVYLTPKEFDLLAYLATDPGAVYRRNDIMSEVWDTNWYGTTKTVDAHVAALRKKLGNQEWIEAVRGVGFLQARLLPWLRVLARRHPLLRGLVRPCLTPMEFLMCRTSTVV
jgi:DNA-binding response OmpR family regulator